LYVNGTGTAGTAIIGTIVVSINCKFWKRVPYAPGLTPTLQLQAPTLKGPDFEVERLVEETKEDSNILH
jgi:hypothetical protein